MDIRHYGEIIKDSFKKFEEIQQRREALESEAMKLEQLITATANMLPDDAKEMALERLSLLRQLVRVRELGLTEATRIALESKQDQWLTVSGVRDRLIAVGFDFSDYSTNPLASISAVLRRLKDDEVETKTTDGGVTAYRWKSEGVKASRGTQTSSMATVMNALGLDDDLPVVGENERPPKSGYYRTKK